MRRSRVLLLAALAVLLGATVLAAAGCGGNSPSDVARDFSIKINNRQFGDIYDGLSAGSPIRKEQSRDDWVALNESTFPEGFQLDDFKVTDERTEGDKATVLWSATARVPGREDQPTNGTLLMVREDGAWKIEQ